MYILLGVEHSKEELPLASYVYMQCSYYEEGIQVAVIL